MLSGSGKEYHYCYYVSTSVLRLNFPSFLPSSMTDQPRRAAEIKCAPVLLRKRIVSIPPPAPPSHRRRLPKCRYHRQHTKHVNSISTGVLYTLFHSSILHLHLNHPPPSYYTLDAALPPHLFFSLTFFFFYLFDQCPGTDVHSRPVHRAAVWETITPTLGASVLGDTSSPHIWHWLGRNQTVRDGRGLSSETSEPTHPHLIPGRSIDSPSTYLSIYTHHPGYAPNT